MYHELLLQVLLAPAVSASSSQIKDFLIMHPQMPFSAASR